MKIKQKNILKIAIVISVIVIILLVIIAIGVNKDDQNKAQNEANQELEKNKKEEYEKNKEQVDMEGTDNVKLEEDGKVTNTSNKLKETKTYKGCTVNVESVIKQNNTTEIKITIKNIDKVDKDLDIVNIEILDNNNKVFEEVSAYFGNIKAGMSKSSTVVMQIDVANMYDLRIK